MKKKTNFILAFFVPISLGIDRQRRRTIAAIDIGSEKE